MPPGSRPACLSQSSIWAVESTWSSYLPTGKTVSSCRYSARQPASRGKWTKPFSIIAVWACMRMILGLWLVAGDGVQAQLDQFLDQLGSRRLVNFYWSSANGGTTSDSDWSKGTGSTGGAA